MLTDIQATLSSAQALTATADSTDYFDSGTIYDWSRGEGMAVLVTVDVAADTASGNETYTFAVETDNDSAFGSATTLVSKTVAGADLTAGAKVVLPFHVGAERYVQAVYTLGGATPSVTVTAEVKPLCDIATETSVLPSGYTVS